MSHGETVKGKLIRTFVLLGAVLCIVVGIIRGDMTGVFRKAVYICLECIGIG